MAKPILLGREHFFKIDKKLVGVDKLSGSADAHAPVGSSVRWTSGSTPERAQVKPTATAVRAKIIGTTSTPPSLVCPVAAQPKGSGNTANPREVSSNDGSIGTPLALGLHAAQPVKAATLLESPGRAEVLSRPQGASPAQEQPKSQEACGSLLHRGPEQAHGQPQQQRSIARILFSKDTLRLPHDAAKVAAVAVTPPSSRPEVVEPSKNEAAAAELVQVAFADASAMSVEDLRMSSETFDPSQPEMRSLILSRLGFAETASIEKLAGDQGAFNDGIWVVTDHNNFGVVLKLVPHERTHLSRPTDVEKYGKIQMQLPNIGREFSLTFPAKVFQLHGPSGMQRKDLVVMRRAPGFQLTHVLYHKFHAGCTSELLPIFKAFGGFMRTTHRVYKGMQHGDCQPSNVFYDESTGAFTLIDIADFGFGPYLAQGGGNDVEQFIGGLKTLSTWYGENLIADCEREFRSGYRDEELAH